MRDPVKVRQEMEEKDQRILETAYRVILASKSPRRKELLEKLKLPYEIVPAQGEEVHAGEDWEALAKHLADQKAQEVYGRMAQTASDRPLLVIGADTIVVHGKELLCKPQDAADAYRMLEQLSGDTHDVYTGVSLYYQEPDAREVVHTHTFAERTQVMFAKLTRQEIEAYIASGDPFDKAGAYGIQGDFAIHVKGICGDYNNVVGLPVARLYHELCALGLYV